MTRSIRWIWLSAALAASVAAMAGCVAVRTVVVTQVVYTAAGHAADRHAIP